MIQKYISQLVYLFVCVWVVAPFMSAQDEGAKDADNAKKVTVVQEGDKLIITFGDGKVRIVDLASMEKEVLVMSSPSAPSVVSVPYGTIEFIDGVHALNLQMSPAVEGVKSVAIATDGRINSLDGLVSDRYVIGVNVDAVPEALRAHFDLEQGVGVIVTEVFDGKPAAKHIKKYDVILRANEKDVASANTLTEEVIASGKESKPVMLKLRRADEIFMVEIQPEEQAKLQISGAIREGVDNIYLQQHVIPGRYGFAVRQAPFFGGTVKLEDELKQELAELKQQIDELKKIVEELKK